MSGGVASLNCKLGTRRMWVLRLNSLATLLPQEKLWFLLSCRVGVCWNWEGYFGEDIQCLAPAKIWTLDLPAYILVSVLSLPQPRLNPNFSSVYPSHCTDYTVSCWFEDNTKVSSKNDRFRLYLLPFCSECFIFSFFKFTLFLWFCVGVKFDFLHQEKNTGWRFVRAGLWGKYLM